MRHKCQSEIEADTYVGGRELRLTDRLRSVGVGYFDAIGIAERACAGFSPADCGDELVRLGYAPGVVTAGVNTLEQGRL